MYLVSNEEMRKLDHAAIDNWCIPSMILMENAGIAIKIQLEKDIPDLLDKKSPFSVAVEIMAAMGWCSHVSFIYQVLVV